MKKLDGWKQMFSVINQLALSKKPFSLNDIYIELTKQEKHVKTVSIIEIGFCAVVLHAIIGNHLQNLLDQKLILSTNESEAFSHKTLFIASEQLLHLGEITPGCIENGIDLSNMALYPILAELRKKNKKE